MSTVTYEQERTIKQVETDAEILERVKRGLAWLEETHGPGWEDKIDLATLELDHCDRCVLGQVYSEEGVYFGDGYHYALKTFQELITLKQRHDHGFAEMSLPGFPALQRCWEQILTPRVKSP